MDKTNVPQVLKTKSNFIQFVKFSIVGLTNTMIAMVTYYLLLWFDVHYLVANVAGWVISVFNAFFWNNRYVFKNSNSWINGLVKTYASYGFSFIVATVLLYGFVEWCRISDVVAYLLVLGVTVPLNFVLNKFWTFR